MMLGRKLRAALCLCVALCLMVCCGALGEAVDYADASAWAYQGIGADKPADLFLVCPTVDLGAAGNLNMDMADEKIKASFLGALNMERGIYEDSLTLYAPYYRQATFPIYAMEEAEREPYLSLAYEDVRAAFLQFAGQSTGNRPFVLAGFSQGADMVLRLLEEFFQNPDYQERLVAAYCIGWRVTDEDLAAYPWLKMAEGAEDVGVIVSFNTEAEDVTDSLLVPSGVKTHGINPLNWRTDSTPATAKENLGACFTNYAGEIVQETPELTGAYLDENRGTLKATDIDPADYTNKLFPDGVYHLFDYQFFFRNLQANVAVRVAAFTVQ